MPGRGNTNWTRGEHIIAFNLYCQIPFGQIHMGNARIIELARLIGRSVGSVSYKLSNFARLDPAYEFRCCITGLAVRELLVASHIVPWAQDAANRLNPRNGLCLNALHDRAFDRGLMWVDDGLVVHFSGRLRGAARESEATLAWLTSFDGQPLRLPKRFSPDPLLLRRHAEQCAN